MQPRSHFCCHLLQPRSCPSILILTRQRGAYGMESVLFVGGCFLVIIGIIYYRNETIIFLIAGGFVFLIGGLFSNKSSAQIIKAPVIEKPEESKEDEESVVENEKLPQGETLKQKANRHAKRWKIEQRLFRALIKQESRWNPNAKSPVGATGLTQVMPFNARLCTKEKLVTKLEKQEWLLDVDNNLYCGAKILKAELVFWDRIYPNDKELAIKSALGSYNAGRNAVLNKNALTAYKETRNYVAKIWSDYNG